MTEEFVGLDDLYGDGAWERFQSAIALPGMALKARLVGHQNVRMTWQSEERSAEFSITFTPTAFIFYDATMEPPSAGSLASLVPLFVGIAREFGIEEFRATASTHVVATIFSHLGFTHDGAQMVAPLERIGEYADWRRGEAEEPEWHRMF